MNIPLIVGEACLKINERIREVISELEIKANTFDKVSEDHKIMHRCIDRLETLNNEVYSKILGEFIENMTGAQKEPIQQDVIDDTIDGVMDTIGKNFGKISMDKHNGAFGLIQSLDSEDKLREILQSLSDPEQMAMLAQSLGKLCAE